MPVSGPMSGAVPLAFIGAHVHHALVIHSHIQWERAGGGLALSQKLPMSGEAACAECGSHFDLIAFSPSHSRSGSGSRSRSLFVVCLFD